MAKMGRPPGERATRPCATCGQPVTKLLSQAKGALWFCDRKCQFETMPPPASIGKEENPYRGQQETRPCARCGEPVTRYLKPSNVATPWTCSTSCANSFFGKKPRTGDYYNCDWCGQEFYRQPAYIKQNRRFCSQAHWNEAQRVNRIEKVCDYCGEPFNLPLSRQAETKCSRKCHHAARTHSAIGREHNGRPVLELDTGYLSIYQPDHPAAGRNGRILEHRWVVEQHLGRYLRSDEQVDHIDGNKQRNEIANLQVLAPGDHTRKTQADRMREVRSLREKSRLWDDEKATLEAEIARLRAQVGVQ